MLLLPFECLRDQRTHLLIMTTNNPSRTMLAMEREGSARETSERTPPHTSLDGLAQELEALDATTKEHLRAFGFRSDEFLRLASRLLSAEDGEATNRVRGVVTPPKEGDIREVPTDEDGRLAKIGHEALSRGELAFCVLAGGMATRMGGVVKALVEALPGQTFLDLRLRGLRAMGARAGRPVPMWLMTSDATDKPTRDALRQAQADPRVRTFTQNLSLRLRRDASLFRDHAGHVSTYATGHGDLPDALRRSGLLGEFRRQGGRYVWITNLDNLGGTIDERLLGWFIESNAELMSEVCDKESDKGGIPVYVDDRLQVLEEFRLPRGFDANQVRVFNTNTFLMRADRLETHPFTWSWFEVEKKVEGETAIQFERLIQEMTAHLATTYVRIPRQGAASRFLPVKDPDELARRRPDIEAVARARGML